MGQIFKVKFKFNGKSIKIEVDGDKRYLNQNGWMSIGLQAYTAIMSSDVYTDDDKRRINNLKVWTIYKMLQNN